MSQPWPGRGSRSIASAIALVVALGVLPGSASAFELRVSSSPDRSASSPLSSATVAGNAYVFISPASGPTQVRFWLDDPGRSGPPRKTESNAPWDFAGTAANGSANPFDTRTISDGSHVITADVVSASGTEVVGSSFTVVNGPAAPDQVHVSWVGDTSTTLTVVWRTLDVSTASTVQYRVAGSPQWLQASGSLRSSGTSGTLHEVQIGALQPSTTYEYRVLGDGGSFGQTYTTRTAPPRGQAAFDAVYFADTGIIGRNDGLATGTRQVIDEIVAQDPLLVLGGGDFVSFSGDTRFGTLDNTIDAWFNQEQPIFTRSAVMPTYGNHEVLHGEGFAPWSARFATPAGFDGRRYYSFDVGDVHFISILAVENPGGLPAGAFAWLQQDIDQAQAAGQRWIVPYMHVPAFSDGSSHGSNLELRAQLGPLFEREGVKVVLSSHDQSYERTYPLVDVPNGNTPTSSSTGCYTLADGVTWLKTSPAGKLSDQGGGFSQFLHDPPLYPTAYRNNTMHHFARLRVTPDALGVEGWGVTGDGSPPQLLDSFEYRPGGCATAYPRPGGATPLRLPLVPAYAACTSANTSHAPPLDSPSCTPARRQSSLLTMAADGRGQGSARMDVLPGNPATPADEADVRVAASATDVRLASGGSDYVGMLALTLRMRITDGANGAGTTGATVQDVDFSLPLACAATPSGSSGSACSVSTTTDAAVPGFANEGKRAVISALSVLVKDAGADGSLTPATGTCPPACGSGDEQPFLNQGVFAP